MWFVYVVVVDEGGCFGVDEFVCDVICKLVFYIECVVI